MSNRLNVLWSARSTIHSEQDSSGHPTSKVGFEVSPFPIIQDSLGTSMVRCPASKTWLNLCELLTIMAAGLFTQLKADMHPGRNSNDLSWGNQYSWPFPIAFWVSCSVIHLLLCSHLSMERPSLTLPKKIQPSFLFHWRTMIWELRLIYPNWNLASLNGNLASIYHDFYKQRSETTGTKMPCGTNPNAEVSTATYVNDWQSFQAPFWAELHEPLLSKAWTLGRMKRIPLLWHRSFWLRQNQNAWQAKPSQWDLNWILNFLRKACLRMKQQMCLLKNPRPSK